MPAPKFSVERAARPTGWNRSIFVSVPSWRPIAGLVLTSPMARQRANNSSVLSSTRGCSSKLWGSPALRSTAEAESPSSSIFAKLLPEKRKCLFIRLLRLERGHVDREAVFHISLHKSLVRFIHLLNGNDLHIRCDVVSPAEVEHFLRFRNSSNRRTRQATATHDQ